MKAVIALIDRYVDHFKGLSLIPFQMEAVKNAGSRGAKYHRFALLNEEAARPR